MAPYVRHAPASSLVTTSRPHARYSSRLFSPPIAVQAELVDGVAPTGAPVEWVAESSYFFRLSAYRERLEAYIKAHPEFIQPASRRNEVRRASCAACVAERGETRGERSGGRPSNALQALQALQEGPQGGSPRRRDEPAGQSERAPECPAAKAAVPAAATVTRWPCRLVTTSAADHPGC